MKYSTRACFLGLAFVTGCATTEHVPPKLSELESAASKMETDRNVQSYARVELSQAQAQISKAKSTWKEEGENDEGFQHELHKAKRFVEITEHFAELRATQEKLEEAELTRSKLKLQAETQQVKDFKQRVETWEQAIMVMQQELANVKTKATDQGTVLILGDVLFSVDKTKIAPGGMAAIERLANFMQAHQDMSIVIEGHADATGDEKYNLILGERRAEAVAAKLKALGVPADRIKTESKGEMAPVATNETPAGRQQNRRIEVLFQSSSIDTSNDTSSASVEMFASYH